MIIKVIPENDMEKSKIQEVEHTGVKEFFMFLTKKDKDGELVDAHDWTGCYKNLIGSLGYYLEVIKSEFQARSTSQGSEINIPAAMKGKFVKKGAIKDPEDNNVQIIDAEKFQQLQDNLKDQGKVIDFPLKNKELDNVDEFQQMNTVVKESEGAEDK